METKRATDSHAAIQAPNFTIPANSQAQLFRELARHHQRRTHDALSTVLLAIRLLKSEPETARHRDCFDRIENAIGEVIDAVYSLSEMTPEDLRRREVSPHRPAT